MVLTLLGLVFITLGAAGVILTKRIKVSIVAMITGVVLLFLSGIIGGVIP
jgi:hypothetical protein